MNAVILQRMWTQRQRKHFEHIILLFAVFDSLFLSLCVGLCDCWTNHTRRTACWNTAPSMDVCSRITVLLFWQT